MRTLWSGFLTFGMVTVPINFHTATENKDIKLRSLHQSCLKPIKRQWLCEHHNAVVHDDELVSAYPISKTDFVTLSDEELAKLPNDGNRVINIARFVDPAEIDPVYFEKTYYLAPQREGRRPFRLLNKVLTDRNKVGLGTVVLRDKENVVAVRPYREALAISTLYYVDEVRPIDDNTDLGEGLKLSDSEVNMGRALIDALSGETNLSEFKDRYRQKVLDIVEAKAAGQAVVLPPMPEAPPATMDLSAALAASLKATGK